MQNVNIFIAFAAGLVSFVSPCVLPLVPSYISFIGGQRELGADKASRRTLMLKTLFFVLGFSVIFVVMGIVFSGTAAAFSGALRWINIIAGTVVTLFGLNLLFNFIKFLNYEKRFHLEKAPTGAGGAMLLGMAFAAGWSPCIGPILASILALAAGTGELSAGVLLLSIYSLGLALPFLLTSLFLSRVESVLQKIKPHMLAIQRVSGVVLIVIGLLMIFGQYQQITSWLFLMSFRLKQWHTANPLASRLLFTLFFLLLTLRVAWPLIRKALARTRTRTSDETATADQATDEAVPDSSGKTRPPMFRIFLLVFFLVITGLQLAGVLEFPVILAGWLGFQGI